MFLSLVLPALLLLIVACLGSVVLALWPSVVVSNSNDGRNVGTVNRESLWTLVMVTSRGTSPNRALTRLAAPRRHSGGRSYPCARRRRRGRVGPG